MKKMKVLIYIAIIGMVGIFAVGCQGNDGSDSEQSSTPQSFPFAEMSRYDLGPEEAIFFDVGMDEALALTEDENFDGILYFGFPQCPWCQAAVPIMNEAALAAGVNIYYVSREHTLREGDWLDWDRQMADWLYERTDDMSHVDDLPNIFVPYVVHLRGGEVVATHRGTVEGHAANEGEELTAEEKDWLFNRYLEIFSEVRGDGLCPLESDEEACD